MACTLAFSGIHLQAATDLPNGVRLLPASHADAKSRLNYSRFLESTEGGTRPPLSECVLAHCSDPERDLLRDGSCSELLAALRAASPSVHWLAVLDDFDNSFLRVLDGADKVGAFVPFPSSEDLALRMSQVMTFNENEKDRLVGSLAYLSRGLRRTPWEERAIYLGVASEWLLGEPKASGEIGFRLQVRAARLVAGDALRKQSAARSIRLVYDARSRAAHFSNDADAKKAMRKFEESFDSIVSVLLEVVRDHLRRGRFPEWSTEVDFT